MAQEQAKESVLREITIDYSDFDYLGMQKIKGYVELHLHNPDGSQLIVIQVPADNPKQPEVK